MIRLHRNRGSRTSRTIRSIVVGTVAIREGKKMNEDHVIAAILTAGLVAQNKSIELKPKDAVALYGRCLAELLDANRPRRDLPGGKD